MVVHNDVITAGVSSFSDKYQVGSLHITKRCHYKQQLPERRAESVRNALVNQGIPEKVPAKGPTKTA